MATTYTETHTCPMGIAGLTNAGVTVLDPLGNVLTARAVATAVPSQPTSYSASLVLTFGQKMVLQWDSGGIAPLFWNETINP